MEKIDGGTVADPKIVETLDQILEKAMPHLQKLGFIFGASTKLSLIVQLENAPGCLVFGNHSPNLIDLIRALREAEAMNAVDQKIEEEMKKAKIPYEVPNLRPVN